MYTFNSHNNYYKAWNAAWLGNGQQAHRHIISPGNIMEWPRFIGNERTTAMSTDTLLQEAKLFQGIAGSFHFLL